MGLIYSGLGTGPGPGPLSLTPSIPHQAQQFITANFCREVFKRKISSMVAVFSILLCSLLFYARLMFIVVCFGGLLYVDVVYCSIAIYVVLILFVLCFALLGYCVCCSTQSTHCFVAGCALLQIAQYIQAQRSSKSCFRAHYAMISYVFFLGWNGIWMVLPITSQFCCHIFQMPQRKGGSLSNRPNAHEGNSDSVE